MQILLAGDYLVGEKRGGDEQASRQSDKKSGKPSSKVLLGMSEAVHLHLRLEGRSADAEGSGCLSNIPPG